MAAAFIGAQSGTRVTSDTQQPVKMRVLKNNVLEVVQEGTVTTTVSESFTTSFVSAIKTLSGVWVIRSARTKTEMYANQQSGWITYSPDGTLHQTFGSDS